MLLSPGMPWLWCTATVRLAAVPNLFTLCTFQYPREEKVLSSLGKNGILKNALGEQDGGGVGGCEVHLSPWIHQEYTCRHKSVCITPAESRQEYLTSGREYIEPRKTQDQALSPGSRSTDSKTLDYQITNPQFSSLQSLSHVWLFATLWIAAHQASLSITNSRLVDSVDSCPWSQWCHPAISSSVIRFSSCPQSLPASGSYQTQEGRNQKEERI